MEKLTEIKKAEAIDDILRKIEDAQWVLDNLQNCARFVSKTKKQVALYKKAIHQIENTPYRVGDEIIGKCYFTGITYKGKVVDYGHTGIKIDITPGYTLSSLTGTTVAFEGIQKA